MQVAGLLLLLVAAVIAKPQGTPSPTPTAEDACTSADCSNRGTCLGRRSSPLCFCQLGYRGSHCEEGEPVCDSTRDCSDHGVCFGMAKSYTCLCNLGWKGTKCETAASSP